MFIIEKMIYSGRPSVRKAFPFRRDAKEVDEQGNTKMTLKYLKQLCRDDGLYQTPELNDILYLHFKGRWTHSFECMAMRA